MEWVAWIALVVGLVVIAALVPRLYRRERDRQRVRGTIPGGFGVVDEAWRPTEHEARLEREEREEADAGAAAPGEPDWLPDGDVPPELADASDDRSDRSDRAADGDERERDGR